MNEQDNSLKPPEPSLSGRANLSPAKQALLEKRIKGELPNIARGVEAPLLKHIPRGGELPLSFNMGMELQRLWTDPKSKQTHIRKAFRITGMLDEAALEQSLNAVAQRHEILRTRFPLVNGRPKQVIAPLITLKLRVIELTGLPETERWAEALKIIADEAQRPYDLAEDFLWRAALLKLATEDHAFILTMNHLISDAWSMNLLVRDIWLLYQAYKTNSPLPLPELPIQFADYAYWQRRLLEGRGGEQLIKYWKRQLAGMGMRPPLHLPKERHPSSFQRQADTAAMTVSPSLVEALKELGRREGVTLYIVMLAALLAVLHRYTDLEDIGVRSSVAGRLRPETKDVIGAFSNLIILRTRFSREASFSELLQRVRSTVLEAHEHQELPAMKLYEYELGPPDTELHPSVTFTYIQESEDLAQRTELRGLPSQFPDLTISPLEIPDAQGPIVSVSGMSIYVQESSGALGIQLSYESARYESVFIKELLNNLRIILEEIIVHPTQRLSAFPLSIETS